MQKRSVNSRELVLSMLMEIYAQKEFSHILIHRLLDKYDYLPVRDKAFIKRLTEGTLERTLQLDYLIDCFSKVEVKKMKPFIRALLRMSVYQILYMDGVPDSAACNEAVKLAVNHKFSSLKGFVNGVLRSVIRNKEDLPWPEKEKDPIRWMTVHYSTPEWLIRFFLDQYGRERTFRILDAFQEERPVTVRIREDIGIEERKLLEERWKNCRIQSEAHPLLPYACDLKRLDGMNHLPGFEEGWVTVQDVGSMLVCEVAGIREGMKILDVCAAPGGKAVQAALKLKGSGQVLARDLTEYKVDFIQENARRQGINNLKTHVWDALCRDDERTAWADILFCDLPCSGLGVMGRKRDIKLRINIDNINEVVLLQKNILKTVWDYLKPGGILIYSTCTINQKENEEQVEWILKNFPFQVLSMKELLPESLKNQESPLGLQLFPGDYGTDGFFLAKLQRKVDGE